ncbi:MAG: hypothetical protein WAT12_15250 [Candidatus Nitrotoga sp.]
MTKQTHQVIGQHRHTQHGSRRPELCHIEAVQIEISFEFLDAVLTVGPSDIAAIGVVRVTLAMSPLPRNASLAVP